MTLDTVEKIIAMSSIKITEARSIMTHKCVIKLLLDRYISKQDFT